MVEDVSALLGDLPPDVLAQLLNLGTLDEEDALLQQQMGMADALRQQPQRRSTPLGAALEGLGGVVSNVGATLRGNSLMDEREALLGKKQKGRSAYADALRALGQRSLDAQAAEEQQRAQYDAMSVDPVAMMTR